MSHVLYKKKNHVYVRLYFVIKVPTILFYEFIKTTENPLPARQTFNNSSKLLKENNYKKIIYSPSLKVQQTLERD